MPMHCTKAAVAACLVAFATSAAEEAMKKEDRASRDKGLAVASASCSGSAGGARPTTRTRTTSRPRSRDDLRMATRAASGKKCTLADK